MYDDDFTVNHLEQWVHFNQLYVGMNFDFYTKNMKFNEGKILFTAPHSAKTLNEDGSIKDAEFALGSLAQTLADMN